MTAGRGPAPPPRAAMEEDDDHEYSPAFAAFALLITTLALAGLVLAAWAVAGL
ncbi:hypothetical protein SAMN05660485_00402 [Blastococcus fimeti]|nr:hypothetical protein SAMN05660485_00402 [Blastococcus fimeti]